SRIAVLRVYIQGPGLRKLRIIVVVEIIILITDLAFLIIFLRNIFLIFLLEDFAAERIRQLRVEALYREMSEVFGANTHILAGLDSDAVRFKIKAPIKIKFFKQRSLAVNLKY